MGSLFTFFTIFSLVLFGSTIDARPDSGDYWKGVMEDQPMPEAIHSLLHQASVSPLSTTKQTDCHTPSATGYHDDSTKLMGEKSFVNDFEPRLNVSVYHDDAGLKEEKSFVKDFEPRPNVSVYHDDVGLKGEMSFVKDFEPRPNVSV
ncbi:hypothetical protein Vadar_029691 [Vaccinium darrowii]|uniref:Uncharacterized protein n=1 Tax=Vaccinium darrowii TaxID=229202 RepID=A0ACB7X4Y3_9ERIC|nr:hypothetical protein Vadar_029691 [Vaccinium darrowii]